MVAISSLTPTAGFTLSDGLVVPSPIIIIDGTVFLWYVGAPDEQGMSWEVWSQDKLKIFETVIPRPGEHSLSRLRLHVESTLTHFRLVHQRFS